MKSRGARTFAGRKTSLASLTVGADSVCTIVPHIISWKRRSLVPMTGVAGQSQILKPCNSAMGSAYVSDMVRKVGKIPLRSRGWPALVTLP